VEAALFASTAPMTSSEIGDYVGEEVDVAAALQILVDHYAGRGIELVERGGRWHFQTAPDLAHILRRERDETRKLSRAAVETLAIIAYHEPVSRAEIEAIRGVQISKGTLDVLMEAGWVRPAGRREVPGRPLTYATTAGFLDHFGLQIETLEELHAIVDRAKQYAEHDERVRIIDVHDRTTHGPTHDYVLTSAYIGFVLPLMVELQHLARV